MDTTIREIHLHRIPLPIMRSYSMSSAPVSTSISTVVELRTRGGLIGFGEACMGSPVAQGQTNDGIFATAKQLAPALIGTDARRINDVHAVMNTALDGEREAKAAFDIACWDLTGKAVGLPLCDLFGGAISEPVTTYHVVGINSPQAAAQEASALVAEGHTRLQLKSGGRPIHEDVASIRSVASIIPDGVDLAVDTNRGWTTGEAISVSKSCQDIVMSMEQPVATEAELRIVRPLLHHPLIIDESAENLAAVSRFAATGLADGFGMKHTRIGGLSAMRAVRDICIAHRIPTSFDDAWGGDIIAAACAHIGSTMPTSLSRGSWLSHPYHQVHYDPNNGPRLVDGHITLPKNLPGLGLALDETTFEATKDVFS